MLHQQTQNSSRSTITTDVWKKVDVVVDPLKLQLLGVDHVGRRFARAPLSGALLEACAACVVGAFGGAPTTQAFEF